MGLHVIALAWTDLAWIVYVLEVILGLGFVIFVHELGHFLVAKLCGVKCEKFYLGFDIGGLKIWRRRWGETEYGIGVLPLGGYVKMLGQEDNPARLREELERAKLAQNNPGSAGTPEGGAPGEPVDVAAAEQALYDPRSYLAQSVPKRMAIISAGVIMNVIFALVMAILAYRMGVFHIEAGVGSVAPGGAAWQANLRPGDRIIEIAGQEIERFVDLRAAVSVGDIDDGLSMVIERPGVKGPMEVTVHPDRTGIMPSIGISNPLTTKLSRLIPVWPGSAAWRAQPKLESGDQAVQIDGQPIDDYSDIHRLLALHPEKTLNVAVRRSKDQASGEAGPAVVEPLTIAVPPAPVRRLGLGR